MRAKLECLWNGKNLLYIANDSSNYNVILFLIYINCQHFQLASHKTKKSLAQEEDEWFGFCYVQFEVVK